MKLSITTLLTVGTIGLILLVTLLFWPAYTPQYPTTGSTVVVFGDSLAAGIGATSGNDIVGHLERDLGQTVINLGVSGDTTADGLARMDRLLATDPRVVVILLGGNDALKKVPIKTVFQNLEEIVKTLTDRGIGVVLVGEPGGLSSKSYEKEYEKIAKKYRTFYVSNILSGLIGRAEYMSDAIHPNDRGYALAAARITPVVKDPLSEQSN